MRDAKEEIEAIQAVREQWMTTSEAADRLDLSTNQVRHLAREGKIRELVLGRRVKLLLREDVERYAASDVRPGVKPSRTFVISHVTGTRADDVEITAESRDEALEKWARAVGYESYADGLLTDPEFVGDVVARLRLD